MDNYINIDIPEDYWGEDFSTFVKDAKPNTFYLVKGQYSPRCAYYLFRENGSLELVVPVRLFITTEESPFFFPFLPSEEVPDIPGNEVAIINSGIMESLLKLIESFKCRSHKSFGVFLSGLKNGEVNGTLDAWSENLTISFQEKSLKDLSKTLLAFAFCLEIESDGKVDTLTNVAGESP